MQVLEVSWSYTEKKVNSCNKRRSSLDKICSAVRQSNFFKLITNNKKFKIKYINLNVIINHIKLELCESL
jgi:hypothetical protein